MNRPELPTQEGPQGPCCPLRKPKSPAIPARIPPRKGARQPKSTKAASPRSKGLFYPLTSSSCPLPSSCVASLNSFTPRPKPRISSGILRPPKSNNITRTIRMTCVGPMAPILWILVPSSAKRRHLETRKMPRFGKRLSQRTKSPLIGGKRRCRSNGPLPIALQQKHAFSRTPIQTPKSRLAPH